MTIRPRFALPATAPGAAARCRAIFGLLGLAVAPVAVAVTVTPAGDLVAAGTLSYRKGFAGLSCPTTFTGTISASGAVTINAASFTTRGLCAQISAMSLPWTGQADPRGVLVIDNAAVEVKAPFVGGLCGPSRIELQWDNTHSTLTFKDVLLQAPTGSSCKTNGQITVSPALDVQP
ncbi:hypothetical protein [Caldimonas brevitalea]|uniref:Protein activator of alkane oxidation PraB n=1 Tax=Caldimonas brevitalea TaxID=413882 RepID=A0A0G3BDJ0_9BURK|nr:hypothetical protein [Caldimonas brevitalea]AKJ27464.1 hypothetical protein AAW51_0773 [Caldimonas brevitalea]